MSQEGAKATDNTSAEPEKEVLDVQKILAEKEAAEKEAATLRLRHQELMDETKKAKRKADEEARLKAEAQQEKLKKDGEYEQLYKSADQKAKELEAKLKAKDEERAKDIEKTEAMKLAAQLADGYNAELLTEFLVKRIKYVTDEGIIRTLDSSGNLTVLGLDALKKEFESNDKFKSLLRGSKATGGGAPGTSGGANSASSVDKKTFESWSDKMKQDHFRQGGRVND